MGAKAEAIFILLPHTLQAEVSAVVLITTEYGPLIARLTNTASWKTFE